MARALVGEDRADDLAQQTMLRALEQPPRRGGDPRPWLGRVMRNLAWSDHRAEGRRRRREARVGEAPADVPATPEALLARSEAHRLLVEDLLALEEPVRHLLILRYFEDLPPAQIARRLDLPPGTVRAQLSRGLDRLRARYRRRHGEDGFHSLLLLAAPPAGGALSGANLPSTVVLMSTSTKALAVFLALAVSAWLLRPVLIGSASDPEAEVHAGESEDPASGFDPDGLAAADPLRPQSEQRLLLPAVGGEAAVTPVAPDRIRLVGRCVDAETGAPLPRCEVTLSAESDEPVQEFRWRIEAPALTGQDGRFQAEWPAAGSAIYVQIAAAEHAVRQAGWSARRGDLPAAGATIDLGDVPMLPAWPIRGRVVDQEGAPLEAVMIAVGSQPQTLNDSHRYSQEERASSDRDGWFETEHPVPAGTFPLRGGTASHRLRSPLQVTVPPGGLAEPVVVVVRAMPSVAGVCLDESGEPVPNLHLSLRANPRYWTESDSGGFPSAMSREDGSFRLYAVVDDRPEVLVEVSQGDCEPLHEAVECLLGAEDVVVCVLSTLSFPLEVVDAATGEPVEDFRYSCMPEDRQGFTASRIQEGQHYPDGKTVVRGVWRGRNLLLVHPLGKEYARPEPIAVFAEEGRLQPVRVELEPLRAVRIRVVDEKGGPVTGTAVEAARPGNVDLTENT
ncbi:MAG: sigma-70 family RNA polymerase sigma factor, partial [Planctomycetes bacterium]|nr:sigma-70 family RNA polymerase sigma factor [Planctomycetota bacterium]